MGEQERGAQVHRQHLIELGGGDVLQRLDAAQPGVADQHIHRAQCFGGRLDELTGPPGGAGRRIASAVPPAAASRPHLRRDARRLQRGQRFLKLRFVTGQFFRRFWAARRLDEVEALPSYSKSKALMAAP